MFGEEEEGGKRKMSWVNNVTIYFGQNKIMEWSVRGESKEDPVCVIVSNSPEWQQFLNWRKGIAERDWYLIRIEQDLQ